MPKKICSGQDIDYRNFSYAIVSVLPRESRVGAANIANAGRFEI
jgi:hypothetical protein